MSNDSILNRRVDIARALSLVQARDPRFREALAIVLGPPPAGSAAYAAAVQQRPVHLRRIAERNRHRARSASELAAVVEAICRRYERTGWPDDRLAVDASEGLSADEIDAWAILHLFGSTPGKATIKRDIRCCFQR